MFIVDSIFLSTVHVSLSLLLSWLSSSYKIKFKMTLPAAQYCKVYCLFHSRKNRMPPTIQHFSQLRQDFKNNNTVDDSFYHYQPIHLNILYSKTAFGVNALFAPWCFSNGTDYKGMRTLGEWFFRRTRR